MSEIAKLFGGPFDGHEEELTATTAQLQKTDGRGIVHTYERMGKNVVQFARIYVAFLYSGPSSPTQTTISRALDKEIEDFFKDF